MAQTDRLLTVMQDFPSRPLCGWFPVRWNPPILRTAARIAELRDRGWQIDTVACPRHPDKPKHAYKLTSRQRKEGR